MKHKDRLEMIQSAKRILNSERCVYAGYGSCDGSVIAAHTVSKCLGLKEMAEKGQVYACDLKPHHKPQKRDFVKTGINQVSTFHFACSKHDNDLFKLIESGKLEINEDTVQLFFLRSMAQEIYEGENQQHFIKLLPMMQNERTIMGVAAKESDNRHYFERAKTEDLTLKYCCLNYADPLPFLATTAHSPFLSISGEQLFESSNIEAVAPVIVINAFNYKGQGRILFSWPEECSSACDTFMQDLLVLSSVTDVILSFLFVETQNLILKVSFYEQLPAGVIECLLDVKHYNIDPRHPYVKTIPLVRFELKNFVSITSNSASVNLLNVGSITLQ